MEWRWLRATVRFDGAFWRRFAELGCVYGPEWWKRGSPPVIAAVIFSLAKAQRAAALRNLQALRRDEIVGMQLDPWGPPRASADIDFCGRAASFPLGPFVISRIARAPLVPVFAVRTGIRSYELRVSDRLQPTTAAETSAAFEATVRAYEALVRERPEQWLLFEDVWRERVAEGGAYEMVPQASGLRLR